MINSSGLSSAPDAISMSRRSRLAASDTVASSPRSWMREVSRAAVFARIVATPSRRFSISARSESGTAGSFLALARSSRISSAITWNFVRPVGLTLPRSAAPSISRTARASTGISPASSPCRARRCWWPRDDDFVADCPRCGALDWLEPERAIFLLGCMSPDRRRPSVDEACTAKVRSLEGLPLWKASPVEGRSRTV